MLSLADASPAGKLDDQQLALLGHLLQRSRTDLGVPRAALQRLRAGTAKLGGNDPAKRQAAARMLSEAGMIDIAQSYLPPMPEIVRSKDLHVLNLAVALCELKGPK